jgi:predicted aldo/keto reductase-like oxidoreductase
MQTRLFDNKLPISLLGFGMMRLPLVAGSNEIDMAHTQAMVDYAFKHGVNYFDTSYCYHNGNSETVLAATLADYPRQSYLLADKMPIWEAEKKEDIAAIFDEELRRCNTDYFDFYLLHSISAKHFPKYKDFGVYEFLDQKKKEGKIRYLGFSFHDTTPVFEEVINAYHWDFAQLQLNYLDWRLLDAKTQYEILADHNIPCIVMEPLRGGGLATLCDDARRLLKAARPDESIASWALRYIAELPNVLTILSGMSNIEQVKDNIAILSLDKPLNAKEKELLAQAAALYEEKILVPCTFCQYCKPCPSGVNIASILQLYNKFGGDKEQFLKEYQNIKEGRRAHNCTSCGACLPLCPQHIDIPAQMKLVAKM